LTPCFTRVILALRWDALRRGKNVSSKQQSFVAFAGSELIARGTIAEVAISAKGILDSGRTDRVAVIDDDTGRPLDIDFSGEEAHVLARLADHPMLRRSEQKREKQKGPGRPRLGVVCREVSLLPRHWSWLNEQRGGASATLRRLVDEARKNNSADEVTQRAIEATHRFMWDMAGDLPGFEEASRALFARELDVFRQRIASWPKDIREQLDRFVARAG